MFEYLVIQNVSSCNSFRKIIIAYYLFLPITVTCNKCRKSDNYALVPKQKCGTFGLLTEAAGTYFQSKIKKNGIHHTDRKFEIPSADDAQ